MRLDAALVKRGLVSTRSEASRLIEEGSILVGGSFALKPSRLVDAQDAIRVVVEKKYVSRGGEKLEHALDWFGISVQNRSVLDAGVSTGGFTDCVLQRGAKRVLALDVGRNQLHEKIKADSRVVWRDGVNVRDLNTSDLDFPCSLVVADLSFISLTKVMASLTNVVNIEENFADSEMVLLVKPQFEAGRQEVSRGKGVISDPLVHARALDEVALSASAHGGLVKAIVESPIKGAEGNIEFLMWVKCTSGSVGSLGL